MKHVTVTAICVLLCFILNSAFVAKRGVFKCTAGWYSAPSGKSVSGFGSYTIDQFPVFLGASQPGHGIGQACNTKTQVACAAYFNSSSVNATDPNNSHLAFVTGSAN